MSTASTNHSSTAITNMEEVQPTEECPSWCTFPAGHDRGDEHDDGSGDRLHKGPSFGNAAVSLRAWGYEYGDGRPMRLNVSVDLDLGTQDALDLERLRQLAKASEAAAAWVEAHR